MLTLRKAFRQSPSIRSTVARLIHEVLEEQNSNERHRLGEDWRLIAVRIGGQGKKGLFGP